MFWENIIECIMKAVSQFVSIATGRRNNRRFEQIAVSIRLYDYTIIPTNRHS